MKTGKQNLTSKKDSNNKLGHLSLDKLRKSVQPNHAAICTAEEHTVSAAPALSATRQDEVVQTELENRNNEGRTYTASFFFR
ncbi:MAG: hypothetical protein ACE14S_11880 [Candidatus Bathyarchaeia archaeon]